ncbi:MAG: ornithine cyclodeaminase family protein [Actinomycetota bacterium]|nr:ornithine cyclodeaminase family protein [Actinomycetota bacterium]
MSKDGSGPLPYLDSAAVAAALSPPAAVEAITEALRHGIDPAADVPRSAVTLRAGELLLMPSESGRYVGVKLATIAPANPARGLPRISGTYVLFDADTLSPVAVLDGVALTTMRTPAVSVAAVRPWLAAVERPLRLVVFGAGPQGQGHLRTLAALHALARVDVVVREPGRVRLPGVPLPTRVLRAGDPEVDSALRAADVVVCATTARTPLFDSDLLGSGCVLIAVGSHEPDAREVDAAFCRRATVVVEDLATARRECGDVAMAETEGALDGRSLVPMREIALGRTKLEAGPVLFKGCGMSWEDLVVAEAVLLEAVLTGTVVMPSMAGRSSL